MKKLIVCILSLSLALSLAACGGRSSKNTSDAGTQSATGGEAAPAAEQKTVPTAAEVTQENLKSFPETDESLFNVEVLDDGVSVTGCTSSDQVIVVPEQIDGKDVVSIGAGGLSLLEMEGLVLPDTVQSIEHAAFNSCANLKYVELGNGLKTIDSMAFGECPSLMRVSFPEGMETIFSAPFYNCDSLTEVVIPASVTEIPSGILSTKTCPNAVVITPSGSAAESICQEKGIPVQNA